METRSIVDLTENRDVADPSRWFHPALGYAEPIDVVRDSDLTINEKRAILAAWASDAYAVEAAPALRLSPWGGGAVSIDQILEALRALDREAADFRIGGDWIRRQLRRQRVEARRQRRRAAHG